MKLILFFILSSHVFANRGIDYNCEFKVDKSQEVIRRLSLATLQSSYASSFTYEDQSMAFVVKMSEIFPMKNPEKRKIHLTFNIGEQLETSNVLSIIDNKKEVFTVTRVLDANGRFSSNTTSYQSKDNETPQEIELFNGVFVLKCFKR